MKNHIVPFYWGVDSLEFVNFYRYTSFVVDSFIELRSQDYTNNTYPRTSDWCFDFKAKVIDSFIDMGEYGIRNNQWDNKIVIECKTSQGNTIFVGFYDGNMAIGLGVRSDDWIKPYPFVKK